MRQRKSKPTDVGPRIAFILASVTSVLVLNVLLFVPALLGGVGMCALGWILAGRGEDAGGPGDDGGQKVAAPVEPPPSLPVASRGTIRARDLASSA
jgi:hypothetical protein